MKLSLIILFLCSATMASEPLPFDDALNRILSRHTEIQVQKTNVNAAEIGVLAKKGQFLPRVSLTGSRGNATTDGTDLPPTQSAGVAAQINVFRWGADSAALRGAKEDLRTQEESLDNIKLNAEQEAVEVLTSSIQKKLQTGVLERNTEAFKLYFKIARERFDHGLTPQQEVDKVYLDLSNAQARLQDLLSLTAQTKANLERLLGSEDSERGIEAVWPWAKRLSSTNLSTLLQSAPALSARPDVQEAQAIVNAEEARLKSTYWSQYPSVDFTFNQGVSENEDGSNQGSTTSIGVTIPIFDKLVDYTRHKIEYETYAAADLRLRQVRLDAESQWSGARDRFKIALNTALSRDKALDVSRRLYDANNARLRQGRASANDIEVDERRLVEAEVLQIDGWANAHVAFSQLCHALGKSVQSCN